ncbi:MAG: CocE/NonD family hydrolase [Gemmatimonadetes bacterium]|nr:CocE/NonD family hydrolase [Gemmatimonadota bacterium]
MDGRHMAARVVGWLTAGATVVGTSLVAQARGPVLPPSQPEYETRLDTVRIPMKDGVQLWGFMYLPVPKQPGEKFPVRLYYSPYRDLPTPNADLYFARRGYVDATVNIRGTGRSEGVAPSREYSEQEMVDGLEVIDWLSKRPWSNGSVGMQGNSWGGFNSLQLAMRNPPALKAIRPQHATDDLYHEDIHYLDGIRLFYGWHAYEDLMVSQSPGPDFPLTEELFRDRFDQPPWNMLYLKNQTDGPFWRNEQRLDVNPGLITIPQLRIGGWYDTYRSSIPRALLNARGPIRAIIGPWEHRMARYPAMVDVRLEEVRFWDYWLKGRNTGVMDEPLVTVFMRRSHPPGTEMNQDLPIPGEWRGDTWPPRGQVMTPYFLRADHQLARATAGRGAVHRLKYLPGTGAAAGVLWGARQPDQRPADAYSLVYDSEPLTAPMAILGHPQAKLAVSATAKLAHWFVRLSDVAPDGSVTLITGAGINGAQRDGSMKPSYLTPGAGYHLDLKLHVTSWIFEPGHRIRIAVSNSQWPMAWPTPYQMTTSLYVGAPGETTANGASSRRPASQVLLPIVPLRNGVRVPAFTAALQEGQQPIVRQAPPPPGGFLRPGFDYVVDQIIRDENTATTTMIIGRPPSPDEEDHRGYARYEVSDLRPDAAAYRTEAVNRYRLPGRELVWEGVTNVRSDSVFFYYEHRRRLLENGKVIRERRWQDSMPRLFR